MNEELCGSCSGSGEGRFESRCLKCRGSGVIYYNLCECCGNKFESGSDDSICSSYCLSEMKAEANNRI